MFLTNSQNTEIKNIIRKAGVKFSTSENETFVLFKVIEHLSKRIDSLEKEIKKLKDTSS